jgi:flavin reductase (DIM6/NTAB) family NADH-FMN oxidoreductase RutF
LIADGLREVMRRFPAGVAVVTVDADGQRLGLTVATIVSLSLDPPLVGVSISRQAALHELLREAGSFAASLLAAGQEELAQHFARGVPPIVLWDGIETVAGQLGAPLLAGAVGWVECGLRWEHAAGDHTLFVGDVVTATAGPGTAPLLYLDGRYSAA